MNSVIELGKQKILKDFKELLSSKKADLGLLVFKWDYDSMTSDWVLLVYKGTKRHVLRLSESDVEAWPTTPEMVGKYSRKLINVVECVMRRQSNYGANTPNDR